MTTTRHGCRTWTLPLTITLMLASACVAGRAFAQTVRPVIVQYKGKHIHGKFDLVNDQLLPVNVIVEAKSFDVTEQGDPVYRPLDPSVKLKLSEMSFRIPAQQTRTVFFEARADSAPAWFTIFSTFAGMPKHKGIEIEIELPHTVYMLPKEPFTAADVKVTSALWDSVARNVSLELKNVSGRLGRVEAVEVGVKKEKREAGSFPLLPGATRRVVVPWDATVAPATYRLKFERFAMEDSLRAG